MAEKEIEESFDFSSFDFSEDSNLDEMFKQSLMLEKEQQYLEEDDDIGE